MGSGRELMLLHSVLIANVKLHFSFRAYRRIFQVTTAEQCNQVPLISRMTWCTPCDPGPLGNSPGQTKAR